MSGQTSSGGVRGPQRTHSRRCSAIADGVNGAVWEPDEATVERAAAGVAIAEQ